MTRARDLLALVVIIAHSTVWVAYMGVQIWRDWPAEPDWLILPAGVTALLIAVYGQRYAYQGQHREEREAK